MASLYGQSFCASCHAVQNAAGNLVGGDFGPELTKIGTKAKPEWLQSWLRNPVRLRSRHQNAALSVSATSKSRRCPHLCRRRKMMTCSPTCTWSPATPEQIANGKKLVNEYGCASCHDHQWRQEAGEFRARPDASRQQAVCANCLSPEGTARVAGLYRRQGPRSASLRSGPEDAAVPA